MPGFCPCYGPGCVEDVLSDRRNIEDANSAANVRAVEEATLGFVPFAETIGKTALAISTGEEEHAYSAMGSLAFDITPLAKSIAKAGKGLTKKSAELRNSTRIADDVLSPNALKNAALGNGKSSKTPLATTLGRGSTATKALAKETKSAQASAKNLDYEEAVYPYQIQDNLKLLQKFHSSNKIDPLPGSDTYGALNRVSTRSWSKKSTDDSVAKQSDKTTPPTTGPPASSGQALLPGPTASRPSLRRHEPGVASYGGNLPRIQEGETWLRGSHGNAGRVPAQVAEQLAGRQFRNFDEFRQEFWKAVADDPVLGRQFNRNNRTRMGTGRAPFVGERTEQVGKRTVYELDHMDELQHGGNVYDMNNIIIRTPNNHMRGK